MEWILQKFSLSFQQFIPKVKADDSEQDPQVILREECGKNECAQFLSKLETCNERVRSKKRTTETCDEEMIDFVNCVDHCVSHSLFRYFQDCKAVLKYITSTSYNKYESAEFFSEYLENKTVTVLYSVLYRAAVSVYVSFCLEGNL